MTDLDRGKLSRTESLNICFRLNKSQVDDHAENIKTVFGKIEELGAHDSLVADYSLDIRYFGQVAEKLVALNQILDDSKVIAEITTEELNHGQCLVQDIFYQMQRVHDHLVTTSRIAHD